MGLVCWLTDGDYRPPTTAEEINMMKLDNKDRNKHRRYIIVPISEVFIKNDKIKLSKIINLKVQFENGQFIVSYKDLGLLAVNDILDRAIQEIKKEFSFLWDSYVLCPEEELTKSGIIFKNKLKKYINLDISEELSDEERQKLIDLIIPKVKISEDERKEIHDILEEMESGKEHRLEDVLVEIKDE